ncbi:MAG: hypothetical protein ACPL3C_09390, partial [Pyrobaculum sp.]
TVRIIQSLLPHAIALQQNRNKRAYEDIMAQAPSGSVIIGVMPMDDAVALIDRGYRVILTRLDGKVIEKLTGRPYDPKSEYPDDVVRRALQFAVLRIAKPPRYIDARELFCVISERGNVAVVFNDVMRQALEMLAREMGYSIEFRKEGEGVQVNPLTFRGAAAFISFPGTTGKLSAEEMARLIKLGEARIYVVEGEMLVFNSLAEALAAL